LSPADSVWISVSAPPFIVEWPFGEKICSKREEGENI